ncbi:MAG: oligosaccharide repeat unit polymerase [Bacteroidota bacterium]|nr:oligosaccharide repeat unit polymerase [Bacteroidota bacterium]
MKKKIMHPAVLFSLIWFTVLLLHFIFKLTILPDLFPLSTSTFLIFFIGTLAFSFGGFVQTIIWQKKNTEITPACSGQSNINLALRIILLVIIAVGLPFYIQAAYRVFLASNIDNFFVGLRTELSYGSEDIGPLKYLVSFSYVIFAVNLYCYLTEKNRLNGILLIANLLISITYAVFVTGRGLFLELVLIYLGLSYLLNKNFSVKKIFYLLIFFMLVFIAIGIMYGKGGSEKNTLKENIKPAAETTAVYLVSPLNALEWERHHHFQINYDGNHSLRFFMKIAEQLKWVPNAKVEELTQPFVFVPYPTNVYTIYSPYIKDFGNFYAWFMLFVFGFIHTFIYLKAISAKSIRYTVYFSFLLFPLFMSFFQDQYLSLFSTWLQVVIYFEGILFLNKFFVSPK